MPCSIIKRIRYAHAPADLRSIVWRISTPVPGPCRGKSRERFRPSSRSTQYRRSPASESRLSRWYSVRPRNTVSDRSLWVACETRLEDNRSILTSWMKRDAIGKFDFNNSHYSSYKIPTISVSLGSMLMNENKTLRIISTKEKNFVRL